MARPRLNKRSVLCETSQEYSSHGCHIFVARQTKQGGKIGIVADAQWYEPYSDNPWDIAAVDRMQAFQVRWYVLHDPIIFGTLFSEVCSIIFV